jgi:hypothetical protein
MKDQIRLEENRKVKKENTTISQKEKILICE